MDKQNEPEYMMMNSKLKADKEINKKKQKRIKRKKKIDDKNESRVPKSKFASKYHDRIESIKNTNRNIERNKARIAKKSHEKTVIQPNIDENKKENIENENVSIGEIKIKNYEEIRQEMLRKFNKNKK